MAKKKILIIEDDQVIIDSLTILLKSEYDIESALDGNEGLKQVKAVRPDLIILDLLMPEKDGFAVSKTLKDDEDLKSIPVIALSSFTELYGVSFSDESSKSSLPTEVYLTKPVDPSTLLRLIKKYTD
jgi:CheY-like chemotaxis protein